MQPWNSFVRLIDLSPGQHKTVSLPRPLSDMTLVTWLRSRLVDYFIPSRNLMVV